MNRQTLFLFFFVLFFGIINVSAQDSLTGADYDRASQFMGGSVTKYIDHSSVNPHWLDKDQFWFRDLTADGSRFLLVNPQKKEVKKAFDAKKLAASLSEVSDENVEAEHLPFRTIRFSDNFQTLLFHAFGKDWSCDLKTYKCEETKDNELEQGKTRGQRRNELISPDGKWMAFIKADNLWVRNRKTKEEKQLTTDGEEDFGYATNNASWKHSRNPVIRWSPDSKKIATYKQDQRAVKNMYLYSTNVGSPALEKWKYELPGDSVIMKIHRVIIHVDTPKVVFLQIPPDPRRSTKMDDIMNNGHLADAQWSQDSRKLAFVSTSRYHKDAKVRIADAKTGKVKDIFKETVATQFESGDGGLNWRYLSESNEIIWFSERDNRGHLYLYDASNGQLKNKITTGDYVVDKIVKVDPQKKVLYFIAAGLQSKNPYFRSFCKVNFNGKGFKNLTPENGTHRMTFSPSENYFIDSYSQPDVPSTTVLKNLKGKKLVTLATEDVSRLEATGWKPPQPFEVKAADGKTRIYGLMFTPTHLDSSKSYPIIDYIYPGPQTGSIGNWSFIPSRRDHQALAELGFIVVAMNGTGNPLRTKEFQDMSYGNMANNTLPDQIAGIRQLAQRYSFVDTGRVGIWGHSGGGFATVAALFKYPNFFDVGIAESGNHDNRDYESDWSDRFNGPMSKKEMAAQANQNYAENLKGKLLLVHGMHDANVPPQNTLLVVQALERANKDFDLIVYPNSGHGYGRYYYYEMRRRWDYFVKHLLEKIPPKEYEIKVTPDPRNY